MGGYCIIVAMNTQPLLVRTLKALALDGRSLRQIAKDSGLGYQWLQKVAAGEIKDPGVNRIEKLLEELRK